MEQPSRQLWSYRVILTLLTLTIVGIALVALSLRLGPGLASSFVDKIATILIVSAVWAGVYQLQLRSDFIRIIDQCNDSVLRQVGLTKDLEALGLDRAYSDAGTLDYETEIENAASLTVLLTVGRTWVSSHSQALQRRFSHLKKETVILLLDPTSSHLGLVARRNQTTQASLKSRITEAVQILRGLALTATKLQILGYDQMAPYTALITENHAYIVPYYAATGRRSQPAFRFRRVERGGSFEAFRGDIAKLIETSRSIV